MKYSISPTSKDSAFGEDIILREKSTTRLLFRPQIINNKHNEEASVKGCFIFQKKRSSENWEDHKELDLNKLKATEWVKLEIKSEEMLKLITELDMYYKIHREYGIEPGGRNYFKINNPRLEKIISLFKEDNSLFEALLDEDTEQLLKQTVKWMVRTKNSEEIISRLLEVQDNELDQLNNLIGITNIKKLLSVWEANKDNVDEEFWQKLFKDNAWVLSQVFASPLLLFDEKAYIGGKGLGNKGGKVVDFIFQNDISKDVALIEIKTPNTKILSGEYRQGAYSIHSDLTGAIVQVLAYKEQLQREYGSLLLNSESDFKVFNPICVVIAGKLDELDKTRLQSFELYRKEMKNILIITFDELFKKVSLLLQLLSDK
ncbi:Shedu immune nuclease family protein [Bacillus halotolerans]|uniref:Shedu immune nuclease family protein n=1 Tax=Bacillus halotolerans TaxID=260554 RepID=UPI00351797BE